MHQPNERCPALTVYTLQLHVSKVYLKSIYYYSKGYVAKICYTRQGYTVHRDDNKLDTHSQLYYLSLLQHCGINTHHLYIVYCSC